MVEKINSISKGEGSVEALYSLQLLSEGSCNLPKEESFSQAQNKGLNRKFTADCRLAAINLDLIEVLQKYGDLRGAIHANDVKAVRLMVEHGVVDINVRGYSKQLDSHNIQGKTALEKAIEWNDLGLIKLLLSKGADPLCFRKDTDGSAKGPEGMATCDTYSNAMFDAIQLGRLEALRIILDSGIDVNAVGTKWETYWMIAHIRRSQFGSSTLIQVAKDKYDVFTLLLEYGAKV